MDEIFCLKSYEYVHGFGYPFILGTAFGRPNYDLTAEIFIIKADFNSKNSSFSYHTLSINTFMKYFTSPEKALEFTCEHFAIILENSLYNSSDRFAVNNLATCLHLKERTIMNEFLELGLIPGIKELKEKMIDTSRCSYYMRSYLDKIIKEECFPLNINNF